MTRRLLALCLVIVAVVAVSSVAYADTTTYYVGNSSPGWLSVTQTYTWSTAGYWYLGTSDVIPTGATVTEMTVSWNVYSSYGYSGLHVYLFNAAGYSAEIPYNGGTTHYFDGQAAKQTWSCRFYVEYKQHPYAQILLAPRLWVSYSY